MKAEIISVGTELLLGQILNTDAQFLSVELSRLGIDVYFQTVVGDNGPRLKEALQTALSRADAAFVTGGLGPTQDDITKETAAELLGTPLVLHEESLAFMREYFAKIQRAMPKNNEKQALLPLGSHVLKNTCGTAPGCIMEKDGKYVVLLPGPPREMQAMFLNGVKPFFESKCREKIYSRVFRFFGIGESALEEKLADLMANGNPTVAPYAKEGEVTIRITAKAEDEESAKRLIEPVASEILERAGEFFYGEGDDNSLKSTAADLLIKSKKTVAFCESCTGGMISSELTDIPGVSEVFLEGVVAYSNEAKIRLGVNRETIERYGAVSAECAREMAACIRKRAGADFGVSVTGIAGPDGGYLPSESSEKRPFEKPIGLVYIGMADENSASVKELHLAGDRGRIRRLTAMNAFDTLIKKLKESEND